MKADIYNHYTLYPRFYKTQHEFIDMSMTRGAILLREQRSRKKQKREEHRLAQRQRRAAKKEAIM